MKFSFAILPAVLLAAQAVVGAPNTVADSILENRASVGPKPPKHSYKGSLTSWLQDHMKEMFNVKLTEQQFIDKVDDTYSANATLVFNGSPVPVSFLKTNVNGQLGNATKIELSWDNLIELQKTPGDNSAGIVAGVIFLDRFHTPKPKTRSTDVFIITIGPDPAVTEKDNRRILDSVSVVVTK